MDRFLCSALTKADTNKQLLYLGVPGCFWRGRPTKGASRSRWTFGHLRDRLSSRTLCSGTFVFVLFSMFPLYLPNLRFVCAWSKSGQDLFRAFHISSGLVEKRHKPPTLIVSTQVGRGALIQAFRCILSWVVNSLPVGRMLSFFQGIQIMDDASCAQGSQN